MKGISIILCCYNSVKRLPKTLEYLSNQSVSDVLKWEVILVNNNSTDDTTEVAKTIWEDLGAPVIMNVVDESQPGLSYARQRGMAVAQYDVYLFCDDDNWLRHDYVENVIRAFEEYPGAVALGGWSEAIFEGDKPEWFDAFSGNFAVGQPVENTGVLENPHEFIYGAGMALRKEAIDQLNQRGFKSILTDRKGKELSSGGDVELIYALKLLGNLVYFDERLHFYHYMPKERMTWDYLLRLRKSMYWSNFVLSIYRDAQKNTPFNFTALLKKIINTINFLVRQRMHLKQADKLKTLFLTNQKEIRKLFLTHIFFYFSTRIKLRQLQND